MSVENSFPIHYFLHPKNVNFTGRLHELQKLRRGLGDGKVRAITQAIAGLGGVGKTQLALEYSYYYKANYDLIWWLRADEEVILIEDLLALGQRLGIVTLTTDQQGAVQTVLGWLRETKRPWLLVFDNADMIEPQVLRRYLPEGGREQGHVVVTSRNPKLRAFAEILELDNFEPEFALSFLMRRSGQNDEVGLAKLAEVLAYFPLALEHAGAYLEESGCRAETYLSLYESVRQDLLAEVTVPDSYHGTILTTWQVAFDKVKETAGAVELLNVCSFLAGDDISLVLLQEGSEAFADTALVEVLNNPLALEKAIGTLLRFSLLEREGDMLRMHRMVQVVVRERLGVEKGEMWLGMVVYLLWGTFRFDQNDMGTWQACGLLLPHVTMVINLAAASKIHKKQVAYLSTVTGIYFMHVGKFIDALPYLERDLGINMSFPISSNTSKAIATSLNNLSTLYQHLKEYEKALPLLKLVVEIYLDEFGEEHTFTAIGLNNLGELLRKMKRYKEAKLYLEHALTISEKMQGPDHPDIAVRLNNLGLLQEDLGNYKEAWSYMTRALAISEKALGANHPDLAIDLGNLGQLLSKMGDYKMAQRYLKVALEISEKSLGSEHPQVALYNHKLGGVMIELMEYKKARTYLENALAIDEKMLGDSDPDVARVLHTLGAVNIKIMDYEAARPYLDRALSIFEKALGSDHPQVATIYHDLGYSLLELGNYNEARPYLVRALTIDEKTYGSNHPDIARDLNSLGQLLNSSGNYEQARPFYEHALAISIKTLDPHDPQVAAGLNNLGNLMRVLGEYDMALPYMKQAVNIFEISLGAEHSNTKIARENLALLLEKIEDEGLASK